jgi:hypothetical protein
VEAQEGLWWKESSTDCSSPAEALAQGPVNISCRQAAGQRLLMVAAQERASIEKSYRMAVEHGLIQIATRHMD